MICSLLCAVGLAASISAEQGYEFPKGIEVRHYTGKGKYIEIRHANVAVSEQEKYIESMYLAQFKTINHQPYFILSDTTKKQIKPLKKGKPITTYSISGDAFFMDRNDQ
jgi:hypothetical protein